MKRPERVPWLMQIGRLTAWLTREGGPAVLVVVGLAVLTYGFATDEMIAVGLSVFMFVFAAVLPRLHGPFKFGARGIEGNLHEQVITQVREVGVEFNLPLPEVEKAMTAASRAVPPGTVVSFDSPLVPLEPGESVRVVGASGDLIALRRPRRLRRAT